MGRLPMTRQTIHLEDYGWHIVVYYMFQGDDSDIVLQSLKDLGCSGDMLSRAEMTLRDGHSGSGLTYTNPELRSTVVVISATSSPREFWATLIHEHGHAARHISNALGMDCNGERTQYLSDAIAYEMYPVAMMYLVG